VDTTQEFLLDTGVFHALSFAKCEQLQLGHASFSAGLSVPLELITGFDIGEPDANLMSRQHSITRYQQMIRISPGLGPQGMVEKSIVDEKKKAAMESLPMIEWEK